MTPAPGPTPARRRLRPLVVAVAAVILAGVVAALVWPHRAPSPTASAPTVSTPSAPASTTPGTTSPTPGTRTTATTTTTTAASPVLTRSDIALTLLITDKKCTRSGGCALRVTVQLGPLGKTPKAGERWRVGYRITGGTKAVVGGFDLVGDRGRPGTVEVSTATTRIRLHVTVTNVKKIR